MMKMKASLHLSKFLALLLLAVSPVKGQLAKQATDEVKSGEYVTTFNHYSPHATYPALISAMVGEEDGAKAAAFFDLPANKARSQQTVDLSKERYTIYVPAGYSADKPSALMVYISPRDKVSIPKSWWPVFEQHNMIFVAAHRSGNEQSPIERRVPLALHALENITKIYNIDTNRIYAAGFSGGGKVASYLGISFGNLFDGALYINGSIPLGKSGIQINEASKQEIIANNRFVFLAEKLSQDADKFKFRDVRLTSQKAAIPDDVKADFRSYQLAGFKNLKLIEDERLVYYEPNAALFEKALTALDPK
jgi:dienelactone hydrolase